MNGWQRKVYALSLLLRIDGLDQSRFHGCNLFQSLASMSDLISRIGANSQLTLLTSYLIDNHLKIT